MLFTLRCEPVQVNKVRGGERRVAGLRLPNGGRDAWCPASQQASSEPATPPTRAVSLAGWASVLLTTPAGQPTKPLWINKMIWLGSLRPRWQERPDRESGATLG